MSKGRNVSVQGTGSIRDLGRPCQPGAPLDAARDRDSGSSLTVPMPNACASFTPKRLTIAVEQVLKVQGYADLARVRPTVRSAAETVTTMVNRMVTPDVRCRRVDIERYADGILTLVEGTQFHCEAFGKYLAGCREVVAFVLTLGGGLDHIERNLSANNQLLEAVFLEAAGWMAVEQATKSLVKHLRNLLEPEGLTLTRRLAPGYRFTLGGRKCEWPLLDQAALFGLFNGFDLPVRLLESGGMVPKMSRSGLYGLRRQE